MLNNLIRLLPGREDENEFKTSTGCYIQGIILTVLDKLMLCQITSYSVIYYLGSFHSEIFEKHKMLIFLLLSEFGFAISMILATVFSFKGMSVSSQYCYVRTKDTTKFIVDTIITTLLWATSIFCTLRLLINLVKIKKEVAVFNRKADSITYHTCRFSFNLVFNVLIFLYVDLLINKKLTWMGTGIFKDFLYIFLSFVGEIFFTINSEVWKETKRILTCKKAEVEEDNSILCRRRSCVQRRKDPHAERLRECEDIPRRREILSGEFPEQGIGGKAPVRKSGGEKGCEADGKCK